MHNRFFEEWCKQRIVRISVVLRTLKEREEQAQRLDCLEGYREGFIRDSLPSYSVGYGSAQQKDHHTTVRYQSLRKRVKAIIQTATVTVILCGIWQMLEYLIYGEVQPRIVDDIMMLFFIQFIYISARD